MIDQLLAEPFPGRDVLRSQLAGARVVAEGEGDSRTLKLDLDPAGARATVPVRVPVEGEARDLDGTPISVLLQVVDGLADEIEIYRVDGRPIQLDRIETLIAVERFQS